MPFFKWTCNDFAWGVNYDMPSRNIEKVYVPESFYHIYNRGVARQKIFLDEEDYIVFLNLMKRYLGKQKETDKFGRVFKNYYEELDLLAFCLMPNHFHMLIYLHQDVTAISEMLRSAMTAFSRYFNKRHNRVGHLFQDRFKASCITTDSYLVHISRYIHLNPENYAKWAYSSLPYYRGDFSSDWVKPEIILSIFGSKKQYLTFIDEPAGQPKENASEEIRQVLAGT